MKKLYGSLAAVALAASLAVAALPSGAADHLDAPIVKTDGRTDITDVYAFRSMTNASNTVLMLNVNPLAGVVSGKKFDARGTYVFNVDVDGDARADSKLSVTFSNHRHHQHVKVKRDGRTIGHGRVGRSFDLKGAGRAWAGVADDPFFFDLQAFRDQVKGEGGSRTFCDAGAVDFFRGTNVSSIVLEVPSRWLTGGGDPSVGVWATTWHRHRLMDQMGRPAINTVFTPDGLKDTFNTTRPSQMLAEFGDIFTDDLLALSGLDGTPYSQSEAETLTSILLPDILTIDTSSAAGFLNGRKPADDVIDAELALVTGGAFGGSAVLTSDCVDGNDKPLPTTFPYVAAPH
jgi:hypothetical protein